MERKSTSPFKDEQDAFHALHQHGRTVVERVEGLPVFRHTDIPLLPDTSIALYGQKRSGVFHFMDLGLSDWIDKSTANEPELHKKFEAWEKENPGNILDFENYAHAAQQTSSRYYSNIRTLPGALIMQDVKAYTPKKEYPHARSTLSSIQCIAMMQIIDGVFWMPQQKSYDEKMLKDFRKTLRDKHPKPPLFIHVHGGDLYGRWIVGEKEGRRIMPIDKLISYIYTTYGKNYFSAVVLKICNSGNADPHKLDQTPFYYVHGLAGGMDPDDTRVVKKI